ncbi:fibrobacter succinogenes major paralogous domain-containing protein [Saccharicrinis sp. FJH54]|uniref:fibrobacter succinogenes major paralogous domain-containing protein n=1 Tax=Saccharicrinis sp. FJH54 TaxID=3344665 RepID=UPI0035D4E02A
MKRNKLLLGLINVSVLIALSMSCTKEKPMFFVSEAEIITDTEGNIYKTITIGDQTWMAENLRTSKYQNGDLINSIYLGDTMLFVGANEAIWISYFNNTVQVTDFSASQSSIKDASKSIDTIFYSVDSIYIEMDNQVTLRLKRTSVTLDISSDNWPKLLLGAQCTYNHTNNDNDILKYGRLYNYYAIQDERKLGIEGWHVPTKKDWETLVDYLYSNEESIGSAVKALSANDAAWTESDFSNSAGYDISTNNKSRFSALPNGVIDKTGEFKNFGLEGSWWSCSNAPANGMIWYTGILNYHNSITLTAANKSTGLSIRLVKDRK